jgi:hypothetical protein
MPLEFAPGTPSEPCAAGTNIINMRDAMAELVGADVVARALASLPPDTKRAYERTTQFSWVPFSISWAAVDAVADAVQREREQFYVDVCKAGMRRAMKTVWRLFLTFTSDDALVKRTAVIFAKSRNCGSISARFVEPGHSEVDVTKWPGMQKRHLTAIAASMEEVLTLVGRKSARATSVTTDDGAHFELRWTP